MMRRTKIKICGITNEEDAFKLSQMAVDALGFIVIKIKADLPFIISLDKARKIIPKLPPFITSIVDTSLEHHTLKEVVNILRETLPDALEIRFGGNLKEIQKIKKEFPYLRIIKCFNISRGEELRLTEISRFFKVVDMFHLDKKRGEEIPPGFWESAREIVKVSPRPVILAGGLDSKNVGQAIEIVRPYAVDLISGVETLPGKKDFRKVKKFIEAVRRADREIYG